MVIQTAEAIYQEELRRKIDRSGLASLLDIAINPELVHLEGNASVEDMRAWVRAGDEYKNRNALPVIKNVTQDRTSFIDSDGNPWKWHFLSDFELFKFYLEGKDLTRRLELSRYGNGVRVFSMCPHPWMDFDPRRYSNYYEKMEEFARFLMGQGIRMEMTVLADVPYDFDSQRHWTRTLEVLNPFAGVHFVELGNEYYANRFDPAKYNRPDWCKIAVSRGCGTEGVPLPNPWDYGTNHPGRSEEWPRKAKDVAEMGEMGTPDFPAQNIPFINDEPIGAGEVRVPGSRSDNVQDFIDFFLCADLMGAGATLHSESGRYSSEPGEIQLKIFDAVKNAWKLLPANVHRGQYTRGGLDTCPVEHSDELALRTFARIHGSIAYVLAIRRNPRHTFIPVNDWRLKEQLTDNLVILER